MSTNPFSAPGSASGIKWTALTGRLLVIEPKAVERGITTAYGDTDAVRADVHVIDGENPESFDDALIFPKVLFSQLSSKVGEKVLGRLGSGVAKPGQSAPHQIDEPTESDIAAGTAWLEQRKNATFAQPAPASQQQPGAGEPPF